jgi:hypothetical protein
MLKTESHIFFQISDDTEKRVLHRAKIIMVEGNFYTAELEGEGPALEDEMDFFIYFEMDRKFMRQAARIGSVIGTEKRTVVEFETIGDPRLAENRQALRISTVGANLSATFGSEKNCEVVDVSPTGFAVYATKSHKIGGQVEAILNFQGETYKGAVNIKSAIERKGRIRYGVQCIDDPKSGNSLKNGLGRITMAIQRQQLARVSHRD